MLNIKYLKDEYGIYGIKIVFLTDEKIHKSTPLITIYGGEVLSLERFNNKFINEVNDNYKSRYIRVLSNSFSKIIDNENYNKILVTKKDFKKPIPYEFIPIHYRDEDISLTHDEFYEFHKVILLFKDELLIDYKTALSKIRSIILVIKNSKNKENIIEKVLL